MNSNLTLFWTLLFFLLLEGVFPLNLEGDFFLSSVISNEVWRMILIGGAMFFAGKLYIDNQQKSTGLQ